jgi:hypothetical protein
MTIQINDLEHKNLIHHLDDTELKILIGGLQIAGNTFSGNLPVYRIYSWSSFFIEPYLNVGRSSRNSIPILMEIL